jgi:hypothetical protein
MSAMPKFTVIKPRQSRDRPACGFVRSTWRVGRCTVTMTINIDAAVRGEMSQSTVEWDPELPPRSAMTKACWRQYRAGRNALYQQVADIIAGNVAVVDI